MPQYYRQDHMKSYKTVQDPMGLVWDLWEAWKDSTALFKILNGGIIQDPTRSHIFDEIL